MRNQEQNHKNDSLWTIEREKTIDAMQLRDTFSGARLFATPYKNTGSLRTQIFIDLLLWSILRTVKNILTLGTIYDKGFPIKKGMPSTISVTNDHQDKHIDRDRTSQSAENNLQTVFIANCIHYYLRRLKSGRAGRNDFYSARLAQSQKYFSLFPGNSPQTPILFLRPMENTSDRPMTKSPQCVVVHKDNNDYWLNHASLVQRKAGHAVKATTQLKSDINGQLENIKSRLSTLQYKLV